MRVLFLMRGAPGCGKSFFLKEHKLNQYSLCADDIRLLIQTPVMSVEGNTVISQSNEKRVWELMFTLLEDRMQKGEFTIIDATNSKSEEMNKYKKLCEKYRYRKYIIDFTGVPKEITKERNLNRESYQFVPEEVIDKMYARFETQKVPSGFIVIKPEEFESTINSLYNVVDFSHYKKIHVIGDLHGCFSVVKEYYDSFLYEDNELYIFVGDYLDRGIENVEVMKMILHLYELHNVILLTGNHEQHIYTYANELPGISREFEYETRPQLEKAGFDKKDIRKLYSKFAQFAYFTYDSKKILVTHGGLSNLPENFVFVSTRQLINGVGGYKDMPIVNESFFNHTDDNTYQIHGHRNNSGHPIKINERCFNLCGGVEFGGELRVVTIDKEGFQFIEIPNKIFKPVTKKEAESESFVIKQEDLVSLLRSNKHVQEKKFGNVSSFNFTREVFYDKIWNDITMKARGLFINNNTNNIVARSYTKFFNLNEVNETKEMTLQNSLSYPLTSYVKYNGFLGLVGYDEETDDLLITSKTSLKGDFSVNFRRIFTDKIKDLNRVKRYLKDSNSSWVFEVIDPINDPHIIKYDEEEIILLDEVKRTMKYEHCDYEDLKITAIALGVRVKEKAGMLNSWQEFYKFYEEVTKDDYLYNGEHIEGFVMEDATGFMFKLKLAYYNKWKSMRWIKESVGNYGMLRRTGGLTTEDMNLFYGWLRSLPQHDVKKTDIITLREQFEKRSEI